MAVHGSLEIKCKRIPPTFLPSLYKSFGHLIPKSSRLGEIAFSILLATNKANIIGNNFGADAESCYCSHSIGITKRTK